MANLLSNNLMILGLSDAVPPTYNTFVKYSNYPDGTDFSDKPGPYLGLYVGPAETAPTEKEAYHWIHVESEGQYLDIRYSDDGETFTEENGTVLGSWMGIYLTDDSAVLAPEYVPVFENYQWTQIQFDSEISLYDIETNYNTIYKFYTSSNIYSYTPATLSVTLTAKSNRIGLYDSIGEIQIDYYYLDSDKTMIGPVLYSTTEANQVNINMNDPVFESIDLQYFTITATINNTRVATSIVNTVYGTTDDMAKLALNAADIVASILSTKLIFNSDGLTVQNGGLQILNEAGERVFYADDEGNLIFTGTLYSSAGTLGGWTITEYGLMSQNEYIGLYAGDKLYYDDDESPIRFWAALTQAIDDTHGIYNFAVTHAGTLYANKANIDGSVIARSGYIADKFMVGTADDGIIIYGKPNGESFIGSSTFASGPLGYGWRLNYDGTAEFNNIIARGKITSSFFEYSKISSVGGSLYIAPTIYMDSPSISIASASSVANDFQGIYTPDDHGKLELQSQWLASTNNLEQRSLTILIPTVEAVNTAPETLTFTPVENTAEHNFISITWLCPYRTEYGMLLDVNGRDWLPGDEIKFDADILTYDGDEIVNEENISDITGTIHRIAQAADGINTEFSILIDLPDFDITNKVIARGAMIVLYGSENRRHGIYLTATTKDGPYMDVYDSTNTELTVIPAVRIGNLSGITDAHFPGGKLNGYGLYSSNAYLRGQLMLPGAGITNQTDVLFNNSPIRLWAGLEEQSEDIATANFIVTENGYLYARQGVFEGRVIARDSEFSGTISAAGILINENAPSGHFYVSYPNESGEYGPEDYVINIDENGLSVWEGGLRAYSDFASGENSVRWIDSIYGYSESNTNPQPYFYLVDDGIVTTSSKQLNARIVANKGHFLMLNQDTNINWTSIVIDDGIWFDKGSYTTLNNIESTIFNNIKNNGILYNNNILSIISSNIQLNTNGTVYITTDANDFNEQHAEKLFVRGSIYLDNGQNDNVISFRGKAIQEARSADGSTIGIDFVMS